MAEWILHMADGEAVEAIVIGKNHDDEENIIDSVYILPKQIKGKILNWDDGKEMLDYEAGDCHGDPYGYEGGINSIYAWTKSWVIFLAKYDGNVWPCKIPRNPIDCWPMMYGGG